MTEPAYPRPYGAYTLLERLGAGGMSEVDLARRAVGDAGYVRFCAIKRIRGGNAVDEQYVRMFQDEARINAELSHENIAQVYDFGREGDEFYMAMEYVPGMDLRAVQLALAQRGKLLPVRIALTILCGVLRALQYAHTRVDQLGRPMNIVHRDVNPRNVMLSLNGEVKLIDFGVAKAADRLEKTEHNTVKGKFAYMAPEQIDGNGAVDGRADLYAVALCLHELLTGRSPFAGLTEVQILHRILAGTIPPLPDRVEHPDLALLRRIHARGLAVRPQDRYPTADAFRADVEAALAPLGGAAPARWIAELLREAAGDGVADITRRLRAYRDGLAAGPAPVAPPPPPESSGTLNVASIEAPPGRPRWMTVAAAGVGFSGVLLIAVAAVGLAVVAVLWTREAPPGAPAASDGGTTGGAEVAPSPVLGVEAAPDAPLAAGAEGTTPGVGQPTDAKAVRAPSSRPSTASSSARGTTAASTPTSSTPSGSAPTTSVDPTPPSGASPTAATTATPVATTAVPSTTTPATTAATPATTAASTPTTATPQAATASAPAAFGYLNLTSRPMKLDVYVGGAKIGATPLRLHRLPVGTHEVVVRDPVTGRSDTRTIVITADGVITPPPVLLE